MTDEVADRAEQQDSQAPCEITWAFLRGEFFLSLKKEGKHGQLRNYGTAINQFLESIKVKEEELVGLELLGDFEAKLQVFIKAQVGRELSESTYSPRVSKLRALKIFAEAKFPTQLRTQNMPKSFGGKLLVLIKAAGHSVLSFWRSLPEGVVTYRTLLSWCEERHLPPPKRMQAVRTIESHLIVPAGTLRLPIYRVGGCDQKPEAGDNSNKAKAALSKSYYVWTETLEDEFHPLNEHKTTAVLPEGEERSKQGIWTSSEGGGVSTSKFVKDLLKSFMGYCALPADNPDPYLRGAGIAKDSLTLGLLADKKLVEGFSKFRRLRSGLRVRPLKETDDATKLPRHMVSADGSWVYYDIGGKYNEGTLTYLATILGLLHTGTGYLYQHPEFALKLGVRMRAPTWQQQCSDTRTRVNKIHADVLQLKRGQNTEEFDFGRDPKKLIQWILDLPRPLEILHQMIKDMLDDLLPEKAPESERARQFRDILLAALLSANPLRIRMFSIMEFGKHLNRREDGSWWLKFGQKAFKNRRSLRSCYEVRVAPGLWPLIDRYKKEFHPILVGSTGSAYVFASGGWGRHRNGRGQRLSEHRLSEIIHDITELYIPGALGFRPHAFRHIVATDIIKVDPRFGFIVAARALHDKLETVETTYIHLKTSEYFEPVNTHFNEVWKKVFG